jgi:hypothetical protein
LVADVLWDSVDALWVDFFGTLSVDEVTLEAAGAFAVSVACDAGVLGRLEWDLLGHIG